MPTLHDITRDDVLQAIGRLRAGEPHPFGSPTRYELVHEGKRYPPKAVVGLAARRSHGRDLRPDEFSSGVGAGQAVDVLRKLGFEVIDTQVAQVPGWETLLKHMRRSSRVYKPAAILCLLDLVDDGAAPTTPIPLATFRRAFVALMDRVGPGLGTQWWEPAFFLFDTDRLWELSKGDLPTRRGEHQPSSEAALLGIADRARLAPALAQEVSTPDGRQAIRELVLELLEADRQDDSRLLRNVNVCTQLAAKSGVRFWWVNQKQTHQQEIAGGYLWSPRRKKNGAVNPFYETMREVRPGDRVVCFWDGRIQAVGQATGYCFPSPKPTEFGNAGSNWTGKFGYRVPVDFQTVPRAFRPKDHIDELRPLLPTKYSPLRQTGGGLQQVYLAEISPDLAAHLLSLAGVDLSPSAPDPALAAASAAAEDELRTRVEDAAEEAVTKDDSLTDTERQAVVQARRGQGLFRQRLEERWPSGCPVTGVTMRELLTASHIKPWAESTNAERLDPDNGLLLSPDLDRLFDRRLISFADSGEMMVSQALASGVLEKLGISRAARLPSLSGKAAEYMKYHRETFFLTQRLST